MLLFLQHRFRCEAWQLLIWKSAMLQKVGRGICAPSQLFFSELRPHLVLYAELRAHLQWLVPRSTTISIKMLIPPYFKQEGLGHYDGQKCCKGCVTSTTTSHYPAIYLTIRIPATASATREVPQQWCVTTLRHHQSSRVPYSKKKVHLCDDVIKEIRTQIEHTRKICNLANKYTKSILVWS